MSLDLNSLYHNYRERNSRNNTSQSQTSDSDTTLNGETNGVRGENQKVVKVSRSYDDVKEGLKSVGLFPRYDVLDRKSSQYELLNRRYNKNETGIYYMSNDKLYEEKVYKGVGVIVKEIDFENFVNDISDEVYRTTFSGDSAILNTFSHVRFSENITYIRGNTMRFDINNPFNVDNGILKHVGLYQPSMVVSIKLKDINWLDVYDTTVINFEEIKIYKKGLLNNDLLLISNDKLQPMTFTQFKMMFRDWFIVNSNKNTSLLDEDKLFSDTDSLVKNLNLNWGGYLSNEYFTESL